MSLSARSYFLAALIALIGIAGQWSADGLADLWRYPAAALVLGLLYEALRMRLRTPALSRHCDERGLLGRKLHGHWQLDNDSPRRLHLLSLAEYPPGLAGARKTYDWQLAAEQQATQEFIVTPLQLGSLRWRPIYTRSLGRLGLAWWNRKVQQDGQLRVTPDRLHDYEYHNTTQKTGDRYKRTSGSGHELLGLRDYEHGDPLRAIDWKATARTGKHTVRLFAEEQHLELMLVIDCGRTSQLQAGALTRLHHYVNVAARLAQKAILQGDHVGLVTFADGPLHWLAPQRGQQGLRAVRDMLERTRSLPRESNPLAAALKMRKLVRHRCLAVVFTDIDGSGANEQLLKAMRLLHPKHLPLLAGLIDEEIEALHRQPAEDWLDPYNALAARETRHATDLTLLQLRRMGCQVIEAKPRNLDQQVLTCYDVLRERRKV